MPDLVKKDLAWLSTCAMFGFVMSKDPNRKVGACIVGKDDRSVSFGYNGIVAGVEENEENWSRPRKYDLVRHAEINAILNAPFDTKGSTLYSSLKPCHECLGDAVNAGIIRVVYLFDPIEFTKNNDEIWDIFAERFDQVKMYYPDDNLQVLINYYKTRHDEYKERNDKI